ncbi:hypothetical protein SAY86_015043 [Trapa natans]|uniref:DUF868 family protein n=1 Tax=Trapa natans TaxID=22666 RepID=A0AAN7KE27_TRANT|nr:hypothetical protein SAY86_015043 [Trapa natans]
MQDQIGIRACFSSGEKLSDHPSAVTRSGQSVFMSVYRTKVADQCRLITITWCKNSMLHGLSVSVEGLNGGNQQTCKVELKPWYFWRKHGSKRFTVDEKPVDVFWDLKAAKFNGETKPSSEYYVAVVCDEEVVLLIGDLRKDAYRRTGCRPALIEPILVSKKEHIFGKKKFTTRAKFYEKDKHHEVTIECRSSSGDGSANRGGCGGSMNGFVEPEMEIKIDGQLVVQVKHLRWKFRGNESIFIKNKLRVEIYWDVHDWLFSPGLRRASFIFKPDLSSVLASAMISPILSSSSGGSGFAEAAEASDFCLFLYAWKVE